MTIQGYILLEFDDSHKTIFDNVFKDCLYKFNAMLIAACIGETRYKRRRFWDYVPPEDAWYEWEQMTFDELVEMVNSGRVELHNHSMSHLMLNELFGSTGHVSGTADSGTTTTTVDSERTELADWWNGSYITFTSGPNNGLTRKIIDFDATLDKIIHEAFPDPVAAGHTYLLGPRRLQMVHEVLAANNVIELITGQAPCAAIPPSLSHQGGYKNIEAYYDEWFAHWVYDLNYPPNYVDYRNNIPASKRVKGVCISDYVITTYGWPAIDTVLNDARNNHYLHILQMHGISNSNIANGDYNLSLSNWATLKSKLADFHNEGRLVFFSELGTLV